KSALASVVLALAGVKVLLALWIYRTLPLAPGPPRPVPVCRGLPLARRDARGRHRRPVVHLGAVVRRLPALRLPALIPAARAEAASQHSCRGRNAVQRSAGNHGDGRRTGAVLESVRPQLMPPCW